MVLEAIGTKLIIEQETEKVKENPLGIIIPDQPKNVKSQIATVVSAGDGLTLNDGSVKPLTIKKDDRIIYEKFAGTVIQFEGKEYRIIDERDVLLRITED